MSFLFGGKKTITNSENKIGALRVQSSSQGIPIPIVFGKTRIAPNLLNYFDFTAIPHTEKQKTGKGGGGTSTVNTTYTYTTGVILGWCEGPASVSEFVGTVWSDKSVTDAVKLGLSQFHGSYSQTPWSYMVTNHPDQADGMRGQAYSAQAAFELGSSDGLPNLTAEISGLIDDDDVNIADIVETILTSDKFGAGWPSAQFGDLSDFSDYCDAAGLKASPAYVEQRTAADIVTELCLIGNAGAVWSEGLLKIKTYADETIGSYTPDLTVCANLTYSDFLASAGEAPVTVTRKRTADAFNSVQIKFLDRSNQYNEAVVEAKDQSNIELFGLRPMEPIEGHAICDGNIAMSVAQTTLQRQLYLRNEYQFTVGWRYALLEPMDIVQLNDPLQNIDALPVRIKSIEENDNGELLMTAEDLVVGVSTPGSYATQSSSGSTPAGDVDPGDTYAPVIFQPPLALTGAPQVWIGAQGGDDWGGAQVWVSTDGGASYGQVGEITNPARYGVLTANFAVGTDPDTTHTLSVDLTASRGELVDATQADADSHNTLSYCDGELVAYSNVTLTGANAYDLDTYIRRGQAGSTASAHASGSTFMRLNSAIEQFDVTPSLYGTTLYVKLLSFNKTGGGLQALADVSPTTFTLVAQAPTGNGFAFIADRSTTTVGDPGPGKVRFNNASQAAANVVVFDALTNDGANMVNYFASVGNAGYMELRDHDDTAKWAAFSITGNGAPSGYQTFNVAYRAGGAEIPTGDTVLVTFSPTPPTGVTSVGLSLPATIFSVANSPVTTTGNLTATLVTQNAAMVWAGPATGNAAAPTFRALVATDIPGSSSAMTINSQSANYTLALSDGNDTWVEINSANDVVVTVPSQANVAWAGNVIIPIERVGAGNVTISPQANVTVHNSSSNSLRAQFSVVGLKRGGSNVWTLFGDTT